MAEVYVSSIIDAPAARVWELVRDFNGLPNWHPLVADSRIEEARPADQVGCVRDFRLKDGGRIRERLLALSDYDYACTYSILESPMGVENYVAVPPMSAVSCASRSAAQSNCADHSAKQRFPSVTGVNFSVAT